MCMEYLEASLELLGEMFYKIYVVCVLIDQSENFFNKPCSPAVYNLSLLVSFVSLQG